MHYMIDPRSDKLLTPVDSILDCEVRAWAASLFYRLHVRNDSLSPSPKSILSELNLKLVGVCSRKLGIISHDTLSSFNTEFEDMDLVLSSFAERFNKLPFSQVRTPRLTPA